MHFIGRLNPELFVWAAGLVALACTDPTAAGHFSLCGFKWIGLDACPGCGLGHAVAYLFRGEVAASFEAHPLGLFAVPVLLARIVSLLRQSLRQPQFFTPNP